MSNKINRTLNTLRIYSFNKDNIIKCINSQIYKKTIKEEKKDKKMAVEKTKVNDFYIPQTKDSLFWCWYIFKNGLEEYQQIPQKYFVIEKSKKIEFIEKVRLNKTLLKKMKIKISAMEGNLANDATLDRSYIEPMLTIERFNFVYIDDKIHYSSSTSENNTCIIKYFKNKDKYGILLNKDKLSSYTKNLLSVESITKPIKSMSNYKAQELRDIATKLKINVMKTATKYKTKKELYTLICEKI